jgi:hypothetical protein
MNHVERFRATMNFQPVDRLPSWEWAMWWDETIRRWHQEGLPVSLNFSSRDNPSPCQRRIVSSHHMAHSQQGSRSTGWKFITARKRSTWFIEWRLAIHD